MCSLRSCRAVCAVPRVPHLLLEEPRERYLVATVIGGEAMHLNYELACRYF